MNEKIIQDRLRVLFANHKYLLTNSYVFSWESDFFSITKSNTVYEVEVKISKADFRKDFEKEKHRLFDGLVGGKKLVVTKTNLWQNGDIICRALMAPMRIRPNFMAPADESFIHEEDSFGYWHRRQHQISLNDRIVEYRAPVSRIEIIDLTKSIIPNRFYYACPEGIIQLKEVPQYAGLIWTTEFGAKIIKQAPFITKEDVFTRLKSVLLDKFWYLSERQRFTIRNIQYDKQ